MGLFFKSSNASLEKQIREIERKIDELEDACYFEHGEDADEDTEELFKLQKKLEELKRQRQGNIKMDEELEYEEYEEYYADEEDED